MLSLKQNCSVQYLSDSDDPQHHEEGVLRCIVHSISHCHVPRSREGMVIGHHRKCGINKSHDECCEVSFDGHDAYQRGEIEQNK
jgi:hypothetical protein